jgi:hypothetical protein
METLATTAHNLLENGFFSSELEGGPSWSRPWLKPNISKFLYDDISEMFLKRFAEDDEKIVGQKYRLHIWEETGK